MLKLNMSFWEPLLYRKYTNQLFSYSALFRFFEMIKITIPIAQIPTIGRMIFAAVLQVSSRGFSFFLQAVWVYPYRAAAYESETQASKRSSSSVSSKACCSLRVREKKNIHSVVTKRISEPQASAKYARVSLQTATARHCALQSKHPPPTSKSRTERSGTERSLQQRGFSWVSRVILLSVRYRSGNTVQNFTADVHCLKDVIFS